MRFVLFGEVFLMTGDKDLADARTNRKIYSGHCTSIIAKRRNKGYWRKLSDEFRSCIGQEGFTFTDHNPGHDAAKCARLFLHYNEARVVSACTSAGPPAKKSRVVERA